jgi:hypothetical protein
MAQLIIISKHRNKTMNKASHKQMQRMNKRRPFTSESLPACTKLPTHSHICTPITQVNLHSVKQKHTLLVSLATGRNILI